MKGLMLKDFYTIVKACKIYFIIVTILLFVTSFFDDIPTFLIFYPCVIAGLFPFTLILYDEKSRWSVYCGTLPCSKAQIVTGKYLTIMCVQLTILTLSGIALAIRLIKTGDFSASIYLITMGLQVIISLVSPSLIFPFVFFFGTEKGRIVYLFSVAIVTAGIVSLSSSDLGLSSSNLGINILSGKIFDSGFMIFLLVAIVLLFALSWRLSIAIYRKKEIK